MQMAINLWLPTITIHLTFNWKQLKTNSYVTPLSMRYFILNFLSVYDNQNEDHSSDLLIVYPSGLVLYVFPTKLEVACVLDMTYWPYDTQICKTKFGSWVYDGYKMNLNLRDQSYSSNMDEVEVCCAWDGKILIFL